MIKKFIFSILLLFSINSIAQSQYFQNYWLVNSDTLYPYNSNAVLKFGNAIFNNISKLDSLYPPVPPEWTVNYMFTIDSTKVTPMWKASPNSAVVLYRVEVK